MLSLNSRLYTRLFMPILLCLAVFHSIQHTLGELPNSSCLVIRGQSIVLKLTTCIKILYRTEYQTNYRTGGDKGLFEVAYSYYNDVVQGQ
jgi:hypothetical protein